MDKLTCTNNEQKFYFSNKSNLTFNTNNKLVEATFLTVLDYADILYIHAASSLIRYTMLHYVLL